MRYSFPDLYWNFFWRNFFCLQSQQSSILSALIEPQILPPVGELSSLPPSDHQMVLVFLHAHHLTTWPFPLAVWVLYFFPAGSFDKDTPVQSQFHRSHPLTSLSLSLSLRRCVFSPFFVSLSGCQAPPVAASGEQRDDQYVAPERRRNGAG